jgi:hypothetical protein
MAQPTEADAAGALAADNQAGFLFALGAGASAALLLFLPVVLFGYSAHLLAAVISGTPLAWQSSVAMTYTFVGIPTLLSLALLFVPYRLHRAAVSRLGGRQATLLVGGLLTAWHAAVAAFWAYSSTEGFSHAPVGDVLWYPFAFGLVAVIAALLV